MISKIFKYRIPQRIKNRMEKWTAFCLVAFACYWFDGRLSNVEADYKECMENRVNDAKTTNNEQTTTTIRSSDASVFQATTQPNDNDWNNRDRDLVFSDCIINDVEYRRRLRSNDRDSWRNNIAAN